MNKKNKGEIGSVTELIDIINENRNQRNEGEEAIRYYFRGHYNKEFKLIPMLLRPQIFNILSKVYRTEDSVKLQKSLLSRFIRYVPEYYGEKLYSSLSSEKDRFCLSLCLAQHHGLPTLLLDWTLNPLAALYFSINQEIDKDGCLWCMQLLKKDCRQDMTIYLEQEATIPIEPKTPLIIIPKPVSPRITAQTGRFSYSKERKPLDEYDSTEKKPWSTITEYRVPSNKKNNIRRELESLQIHEGTMFPDLDGYARYLASGGL